jgi:hypothetical protein
LSRRGWGIQGSMVVQNPELRWVAQKALKSLERSEGEEAYSAIPMMRTVKRKTRG